MESQLDRYARTRGAAYVGLVGVARQSKIQTWVGAGLLGISTLIGGVALALREPVILAGVSGAAVAGIVNLSFGLAFRRPQRRDEVVVEMSEDARRLLRALVMRAQVWQGGWRPRSAPLHGPHAWPGYAPPLEPSTRAMDALERAADAYRRIADALDDTRDERSLRLRGAADAGMGEALHLAATQQDDALEIERIVLRMDELAGLVARSVDRAEAVSPLRSNLEATIEDLRAEDVARTELQG